MYLVPKNVGARFEFIEGFGIKELIYCAIGGLFGLGITFVISIFTASFFKFLPIPFFIAITFMAVRVDSRLGSSILQNFLTQYKFQSKPRKYDYIYGEGRKR